MLQVYSHNDIPWILVQGQPTAIAIRAFGLLRHEGGFPESGLSPSEHRVVMRELREHGFASVSRAIAQRLLSTPCHHFKGRLTRWLPQRIAWAWQA